MEGLQKAVDHPDGPKTDGSAVCYIVAQVAELLKMSTYIVRDEIKRGTLGHVIVGARLQRIPAGALAERLSRWSDKTTVPPARRVNPAPSTPPTPPDPSDDARVSDQQRPLL